MLKRPFLLLLYPMFFLLGDSSFITPMEYASSLYENPRGIGCNKCHGTKGEGLVLAKYGERKSDKILKKEFVAPAINTLEYAEFYYALNRRIKGMPRYFLTDSEISTLHYYLEEKNKDAK